MKSEVVRIEINWDIETLYEELSSYHAEKIIDELPSESICHENDIEEHLDELTENYGCLALWADIIEEGSVN